MTTKTWKVCTRGTITPHRLSPMFRAISEKGDELNLAPVPQILCVNIGPKLWWLYDEPAMQTLWDAIARKCATPEGVAAHTGSMEADMRRAIAAAENMHALNPDAISDEEIAARYDRLYEECRDAHAVATIDIDITDALFEPFLHDTLRSYIPSDFSEEELAVAHEDLFRPAVITYVAAEDLSIAQAVKSGKESPAELCDRFYWTNLGWENMRAHDESYFRERMDAMRKEDIPRAIAEIDAQPALIRKARESAIERLHLPPAMTHWLDLLDRYAMLHDLRKEMQTKTLYEFHRLLEETARRRGTAVEDLEWLWHAEVQALLRGGSLDVAEIGRRKRAVGVLTHGREAQYVSGDEALDLLARELPQRTHEISEFRGQIAMRGKTTGRVKVCNGYEDALHKIKEGDILVCGMTMPDYVSAMKKAAAIVTDEGGLTCHAAIISRELRKPCIMGTKIATQVLKDGDLVEVDADTGVIRII